MSSHYILPPLDFSNKIFITVTMVLAKRYKAIAKVDDEATLGLSCKKVTDPPSSNRDSRNSLQKMRLKCCVAGKETLDHNLDESIGDNQ